MRKDSRSSPSLEQAIEIASGALPRELEPGDDLPDSWLPTPAACNPNDGEAPETWLERRERVKETANNGNGMGMPLSVAVRMLPTPQASDGNGGKSSTTVGGTRPSGAKRAIALTDLPLMLPTPRASRGASTTETSYALGGKRVDDDRTQGEVVLPTPRTTDANGAGHHGDGGPDLRTVAVATDDLWGKYGPAIRRWEGVLGRPAPDPTEPNSNGKPRLSARFVEWLMGLPAGWVTGHGLSRGDELKILGNGVVPQQAVAALWDLLAMDRQVAA